MLPRNEDLLDLLSWAVGKPHAKVPSIELVDAACREELLEREGKQVVTLVITDKGRRVLDEMEG